MHRHVLGASFILLLAACAKEPAPEQRLEVKIPRADGTEQPAFVMLPRGFEQDGPKVPLLVSLHSWSADYTQRREDLEPLTMAEGWIYLFPNFRGRNDNPDACGSELAQQDILDAVEWAKKQYPVDASRIYLVGTSGGGHMTMLMAAKHPEVWAAASAWVGISDLTAWHAKHAEANYGAMLRACTGGAPGASAEVDAEYQKRSPLGWMAGAKDVPLDIEAGIKDGHEGSVPIRQSIDAFNVIAEAVGGAPVTEEEIQELSASPEGRLANPQPSDQAEDTALGRKIYLRRTAGKARITIFEGGHEGIGLAAIDWVRRFRKE
ncbi:MAG: prolyl oligopeptidase family serine peptidase [Acidobacteria bacterium]|nr:prolyl oligopeptidase family serine peptidase [Acidobacteriota bacterium]